MDNGNRLMSEGTGREGKTNSWMQLAQVMSAVAAQQPAITGAGRPPPARARRRENLAQPVKMVHIVAQRRRCQGLPRLCAAPGTAECSGITQLRRLTPLRRTGPSAQ